MKSHDNGERLQLDILKLTGPFVVILAVTLVATFANSIRNITGAK